METKTEEFINLLDKALEIAEQIRKDKQPKFQHSEGLNNLISSLESIKSKTLIGKLEASGGTSTLGLARGVSDWIEPLDSPLLKTVGTIEEYYQKYL